jgi:endonuclease/exonuclease/phosphatase (EEP) superfamily protein YafD
VFSPITYQSIRFRRYSGWLLVLMSLALHAVTIFCYSRQPDSLAAFTVVPLWIWGLLGLTLSSAAMLMLRAPLSLIVSIIWIITILLGADETKVLANLGKATPTKNVVASAQGQPAIRVLTLNCKNYTLGNPSADILAWNADIILLQEIHPYFVKGICEKAFGGNGHYRVHDTSGIISRWPITRDGRIAHYRDHQVTVGLPDGSSIEVVNVHLSTAATDARLWLRECWRTHKANRLARRRELGIILQTLETVATPVTHAVIIGGDFNAPAQDTTYRLLDRDFQDAYLASGAGWSNTFPRKLPLMRLDHIYSTKFLKAVRSGVETIESSDHRVLVVDFVRSAL